MEKRNLKIKKERLIKIIKEGKPIFGSLSSAYLPCGNPNCKCARGLLHGPMWRIVWKEPEGKQHILYVPKKRLERIKEMATSYKEARKLLTEIGLLNLSLLHKEIKKR